MDSIVSLLSEFEDDLNFDFRKDMPYDLPGLIVDKTIYVNATLPEKELKSILAEEIGHFKTTSGNIIDQSLLFNRKQEEAGRRWSYIKQVPYNQLIEFISNKESVQCHEIAEHFNVTEETVVNAINLYRVRGFI